MGGDLLGQAVSLGERAGARDGSRRQGGDLARVRAAARQRKGRLALALLLGSLAVGSAVGLMATSGWLISRASEQPPVMFLMIAVTATRAFGIGRAVFRYAERLVSHDAVLRMLADTRVAVFRRLERLAPAGLRTTRRGDLLSRLVADVDALQDYWLRWLLPAGAAAAVGLGSVGFTAWLLPEAGAVLAVGLLAAGVGVPLVSGAVARRAERRLAPARGVLATRVADLLTGTAELTVAGALRRRTDRAKEADAELTRIASRTAAATALGDGLTALATGLTVAAAALVGVQGLHDGRLSGVALAVVVLTPLAAFEAVLGLPLAVQYRQRVRKSAERVHEILDAPEPVCDPADPADPAGPAQAPRTPFPLRLDGLRARHEGQERDALADVSLTLERGRRVAVVGPSGSGKTTLAQVLLRFLGTSEGTYALGGTDVTALDGDTVRRFVGLCAQDAHVFDSSVRENLLLARKDASDDELYAALGRARLDGWVASLPDGLDTLVGEHGARLSGGQRQRLALARALLADFPVLVLDEPAEHLDLPTADALTADLLAATEGRTTLLITHRLAGLDAVDEVLVLDEGRVAQRGRTRSWWPWTGRCGGCGSGSRRGTRWPGSGPGPGSGPVSRSRSGADGERDGLGGRVTPMAAVRRGQEPVKVRLSTANRTNYAQGMSVPPAPAPTPPPEGSPDPAEVAGQATRSLQGLSTELTARVPQLLEAMRSVGTGLELHTTLDRICETAAELTDARYAAIGVVSEDGDGLADFVYTGIDEAAAARIGRLPDGHRGLLGALIHQPETLRLADLASDPRSCGFPAHHPPMRGFLGVPIRVQGRSSATSTSRRSATAASSTTTTCTWCASSPRRRASRSATRACTRPPSSASGGSTAPWRSPRRCCPAPTRRTPSRWSRSRRATWPTRRRASCCCPTRRAAWRSSRSPRTGPAGRSAWWCLRRAASSPTCSTAGPCSSTTRPPTRAS
ncbi:hypothetical protein SMD44_04264 [Streptomyces alboflavus]|uniref:ABC transporter n=1 Tax=Streptomyces alboflavus TaxID=67267 RepID=A0A1Z1WEH0_9ACTN|nr:hypothetical protein SMD44_04264 [Streptomyces alboflavus]